jgi:D-alanyl-lipoteichoic acid acyltransferase DltB (MBOAT superfamily)
VFDRDEETGVASILFYALWRVEFVLLITFSAWVDYFFSLRIWNEKAPNRRRLYLICSLSTNLGLLLYFKYTYFLVSNVEAVGALLGQGWTLNVGNIVLPLGISFYTFLSVSYTVDVYRGLFRPVTSFRTYLTYVLFWPHMIAGPILRAHELIGQLVQERRFRIAYAVTGVRYVVFGLFLKVVLADNLAPLVDAAFASNPRMLGGLDVWTMAYAFGLQIYFDFAGYSMVAIGSARLIGISFPENFNWPYLATSPREFWKRWHITLSSWIRDYLYLPLCGARYRDESVGGLEVREIAGRRPARMTAALFVTWFVMGLWHGASWKFAAWGLWHATLIFIYRILSRNGWWPERGPLAFIGWGITISGSMLAWILFRAPDLRTAYALLARIADIGSYSHLSFRENFYLVTFLTLVFMLALWAILRSAPKLRQTGFIYNLSDTIATAFVFGLVFIFLRPVSQFIYFQF